jgi:hypothetical protein
MTSDIPGWARTTKYLVKRANHLHTGKVMSLQAAPMAHWPGRTVKPRITWGRGQCMVCLACWKPLWWSLRAALVPWPMLTLCLVLKFLYMNTIPFLSIFLLVCFSYATFFFHFPTCFLYPSFCCYRCVLFQCANMVHLMENCSLLIVVLRVKWLGIFYYESFSGQVQSFLFRRNVLMELLGSGCRNIFNWRRS